MKNIATIIVTLTIGSFLIGGCSGKGSISDNNDSNGTDTTITTMPSCGSDTDLGKSVAVSINGKTIQKIQDDAEVRIWHYPNGEKLGCIIIGEASLVSN